MISEAEESKVVTIQIRISPKQAVRLEKFYTLLRVKKSDLADLALEEFFSVGQEEVMRKITEKGLSGRMGRK
ncbi:MAG: hypothetical protein SA339_13830 [Methanomassiliicoccus sp.]|nr:hypothetical protein [Methanomassiliicoccus sp.]